MTLFQNSGIEIWSKPILPNYENFYSYAIAFINRRHDGTPSDVGVSLQELGLVYSGGYVIEVSISLVNINIHFLLLIDHFQFMKFKFLFRRKFSNSFYRKVVLTVEYFK